MIKTSVGIVLTSEKYPDLKDVLKAATVKQGSYAAKLVERIYVFFIDTAIDLTAEYNKYYESEYTDMPSFLYHKYAMNEDDLSKLSASFKTHNRLLFIEKIRWGRDYQIDNLLSTQRMEIIFQCKY